MEVLLCDALKSVCIALGPTDAKEIGQAMPIIESKSMNFYRDET